MIRCVCKYCGTVFGVSDDTHKRYFCSEKCRREHDPEEVKRLEAAKIAKKLEREEKARRAKEKEEEEKAKRAEEKEKARQTRPASKLSEFERLRERWGASESQDMIPYAAKIVKGAALRAKNGEDVLVGDKLAAAMDMLTDYVRRAEKWRIYQEEDAVMGEALRMINDMMETDKEHRAIWELVAGCVRHQTLSPPLRIEVTDEEPRVLALTCPSCKGLTVCLYGTEYYHCSKCGQKLQSIKKRGIWG